MLFNKLFAAGKAMEIIMKKRSQKPSNYDYFFGKPRLEMTGRECLVDGLKSVVEYSDSKIIISLGSRLITFFGDELCINSFTKDGAIVEGNIISMEFSEC